SVRYHAHFSAAEIVNEQILEPHSFNTEDSPRVFIATILHSIILVGIRRGRRRFEQLNQVADREPFWRFARIVIAQDSHPKLCRNHVSTASSVGDNRHVLNELLVVKEFVERTVFARIAIHDQQRKDSAVWMAIARRPSPGSVSTLQHIHHAGESAE